MPNYSVDPRNFQFGNAFINGLDMAADNQRRNALVDIEKQQFGLQQRDQAMQEQLFASQQAQLAEAKQKEAGRVEGYKKLLKEFNLPEEIASDAEMPDLARELVKAKYKKQFGPGADGFGNVNPGEFDPASIDAYRKSGNYSDLRRIWAPPGVVVRDVAGVSTVVDPSNRLGRGVEAPLTTPDEVANNAALKEGATTTAGEGAKVQVAAQADLPRIESTASQTQKALRDLALSPAFNGIFGLEGKVPVIPGTPRADAMAKWGQIQGKAFLEAFNTLKGGGQITEAEGTKATSAITTLADRNQSPAAARQAIKDLMDVVNTAVANARKKAKQPQNKPAPAQGNGQWSIELAQ